MIQSESAGRPSGEREVDAVFVLEFDGDGVFGVTGGGGTAAFDGAWGGEVGRVGET
jgi:hypothetical protein